ncbi:MAG: PQQ-dependent dehydrogenase, methanol/ethanol family [Gammaproteobacteria bacterium]
MPSNRLSFALISIIAWIAGCDSKPPAERMPVATGARIIAADAEPDAWLTHGRTYSEQRYSPLDQIDHQNVTQLGLAWSLDLNTQRGVEATPLFVDDVLYLTTPWSRVLAVSAATGQVIWEHDPQVPRAWARNACCDVVNRGAAYWDGRIYAGTLDGRLLALDAESGELIWSVLTIDRSRPYTITGAPRAVKGRIIIGNGGAEYGVRGYVSAYDAVTGELVWRFYTVPGNPADGFESAAMAAAAKTWSGSEWWHTGGGGTVWDSMAYDPDLDLLYIGTGNGAPWNHDVRSPGGGDNLYLSSILALDPDTGELVWFYQTTPADTWDFTATQHMILADLTIDGRIRKVLMQAPKNGFFYVLDRETGEFLSAEHYVNVNWATGVDAKTGRPQVVPEARYREQTFVGSPTAFGGHNWHPMSYNPGTGLVYIPANEASMPYPPLPKDEVYSYKPGQFNLGNYVMESLTAMPREFFNGHLSAWDPVAQKEVWRVQYDSPWNGGTLTTAGNLVFQGTADGHFAAYDAGSGATLWRFDAQTGIVAAPIAFAFNGAQYIAVLTGWGGIFALVGGDAAFAASGGRANRGRLLVFRLGGTAQLPPIAAVTAQEFPLDEDQVATPDDPARLARGETLFAVHCARCHGAGAVGSGVIVDLRALPPDFADALPAIVLGGSLVERGMPAFADRLTLEDTAAIGAYIRERKRQAQISAR